MKKLKLMLVVCLMCVLSVMVTNKVSAASGSVTLYQTYAFYEVDNRPYAANLSMNCIYKSKDALNVVSTKTNSHQGYGVYLTNRIDASAHFISYYGNITYYIDGYYQGSNTKYY